MRSLDLAVQLQRRRFDVGVAKAQVLADRGMDFGQYQLQTDEIQKPHRRSQSRSSAVELSTQKPVPIVAIATIGRPSIVTIRRI
jgi:hypothetical protein